MSPTTDDRDRVDEHYQRALRKSQASNKLRRQQIIGVVLTIIGILIVVESCVLFLLSVKPS